MIDMGEKGRAQDGGATDGASLESFDGVLMGQILWAPRRLVDGYYWLSSSYRNGPYRGSGRGEDCTRLPAATLSHLTSLASGWEMYFTFVKLSSSIRW